MRTGPVYAWLVGTSALWLAGCATQGVVPSATAPLVVRTAAHELRIAPGQCVAVKPHTCTPEDGYGLPQALIVSFRPLSGPDAACERISDVAMWESQAKSASTRPLIAEYSQGPADACALTTCFVVGDAHTSASLREVGLSWRSNGRVEQLSQTVVLTPTPSGQFVLQFRAANLAGRN